MNAASTNRKPEDVIRLARDLLFKCAPITHTVLGDDAYIGTNVEYAPIVELGTSKRKPKPYLKPAIQQHMNEYNDILKEEFLKVSSKYGS